MLYLLYSVLLAAALLLSLPYWLLEMLRHGKYRRGFSERMGKVSSRLKLRTQNTLWVHAVSVGEVLAVAGLIEQLKNAFPNHQIFISTTTDTGQVLARKRFGEDSVFYFPLDFAFAIRPYLRALQPSLIVLAETEFWPNFLRLSHASGARIAVVNARISDRSLPRYLRLQGLWRNVLSQIDLFLAQTGEDAKRLAAIGAPPNRIGVTGNLKFDVPKPRPLPIVDSLRSSIQQSGGGPILVCGSTVEGEEPLLLQAFHAVLASYPKAVMILAPRHPERFESVLQSLRESGLVHSRRSLWTAEPICGGVLLLDTIGELASLYALADIAFVGGSLVPRGGHNILEPAQHGVPIVVGPHTENFRDIVALFRGQNAVRATDPVHLSQTFLELLSEDQERRALGQRAAETVRSQAGATTRTIAALRHLLAQEAIPPQARAAQSH